MSCVEPMTPIKFNLNFFLVKLNAAMLNSSLCDYRNARILVKGIIIVANTAVTDPDANNTNKKVIFTNCAPFTNCASK